MVKSENGIVQFDGRHGIVLADIISILDAVNVAVEQGDIDNDDLYAMFESSPETFTVFTKNFVKATHK